MRTTHILNALIATMAVFSMSACKKNKETPKSVEITITSPTAGSMFHLGDTVEIHAHVKANFELHGWEVVIKKVANGQVVFMAEDHVHAEEFHIDTFWINNVTEHSDMELHVSALIDHDGNKETKVVAFHCHPM